MRSSPPLPLDVLLAHEPLVRSVARAVLRGDAAVDDVVQDTWVRALREGPRDPRAAGSWLRRIARNRALGVLRTRGRRRRRERVAARPERAPDVADIVEREAVRRWLIEGILGLAEPYRTCLLLRFYEDLPPRGVARRSGVPVETAKTRIRRGLALLRERLSAHTDPPGGDFRGAVAGLAGLGGISGIGAASVAGGVAVGTKSLIAVGAAAVILALGLFFVLGREDAKSPAARVPEPEPVAQKDPAPAPEPATLAPRPAEPAHETPAAPADDAIRAVVMDAADGAPVSGARVCVMATKAWEKRVEERFEPDPHSEGFVTTTDAEGRFVLEAAPGEGDVLLVLANGYEVGVVKPAVFETRGGEPARITMRRGRALAGVVLTTEGRPLPFAHVAAYSLPPRPRVSRHAVCDAEGRFRFRYLPAIRVELHVGADGYAFTRPAVGVSASTDSIEIRLKRTGLHVWVEDAVSGAPIENAGALLESPDGKLRIGLRRKREGSQGPPPVPGRLTVFYFSHSTDWFPHDESTLYVFAPGYATQRRSVQRTSGAEAPVFEIRMRRKTEAVALAGQVRGASGVTIEVRAPRPPNWVEGGDASLPLLATVPADEDGAFIVRGLPAGSYRLVARAPGAPAKSVDVKAPADDLLVELGLGGAIEVEVTPPGEVWVHLEQPGGRTHWARRTDEEGRALFADLPPGPYRATIAAREPTRRLLPMAWADLPVRATCELAAGGTVTLRLPQPTRRAFTIRVVDEHGHGREGVRVRLSPSPMSYAALAGGRMHRPGSRPLTDADGRMVLDLFPGSYGVKLLAGAQQRDTWVKVGRSGDARATFVLARETRRIEGRVVDADTSSPIVGRRVEVTAAGAEGHEILGHGGTDERGFFVVEGVPAQPVELHIITNLGPTRSVLRTNAYPGARLRIEGAAPSNLVVELRTTKAMQAEDAVLLTIVVRDADTAEPIAGGFVSVEVRRGALWVDAGRGRIAPTGQLAEPLALPEGEHYLLRVSGPFEADPPYLRKTFEAVPEGRELSVDISLERRRDD